MKRLALAFALTLSAGLTLMRSPVVHAAVLTTEPHVFSVTANHRVHLEFPVGELKVFPTDGSKVEFRIRVKCTGRSEGRCSELADELVLQSDDRSGTLHLKLEDYPKWHNKGFSVHAELYVPRKLPIEIDMGVGELDMAGMEGDLEVDLGVGDADIRTPRSATGHIMVDTGIGDAEIRGSKGEGQRSGFVGSRASWREGTGKSTVRLHVGVGDATVRIE
jgi:hypothetical protein